MPFHTSIELRFRMTRISYDSFWCFVTSGIRSTVLYLSSRYQADRVQIRATVRSYLLSSSLVSFGSQASGI